jgi:hypothetical protein
VFLYAQGIPRSPFWETRAQFEKHGIAQGWVTEMAFIHGNVLEMLVHQERAEEIMHKLNKLGFKTTLHLEDVLGAEVAFSTEFLTGTRTRMKSRMETLPAKARGIRHHLRERVDQLEATLKDRMPKTQASC